MKALFKDSKIWKWFWGEVFLFMEFSGLFCKTRLAPWVFCQMVGCDCKKKDKEC